MKYILILLMVSSARLFADETSRSHSRLEPESFIAAPAFVEIGPKQPNLPAPFDERPIRPAWMPGEIFGPLSALNPSFVAVEIARARVVQWQFSRDLIDGVFETATALERRMALDRLMNGAAILDLVGERLQALPEEKREAAMEAFAARLRNLSASNSAQGASGIEEDMRRHLRRAAGEAAESLSPSDRESLSIKAPSPGFQ